MSNHDETDLLTQVLRERAAEVGQIPVGLQAVRGRARRIRRRRAALRGAVAAAAVAGALSGGIAVDAALDRVAPYPETSPTESPTGPVTPQPSDATTPTPAKSTELTLRGLVRGSPAQLPYLLGEENRLVTPDGSFDTPGSYSMITPFADGWLALEVREDPGGGLDVVFLDKEFNETSRQRSAGFRLVPNEDRTRVAYTVVDGEGRKILVDAATDGRDTNSWPLPDGDVEPVGYLGPGAVLFRSSGVRFETFLAEEGQDPVALEDFSWAGTASDANGLMAVPSGKGCRAVTDPRAGDAEPLWETCEYEPVDFSPDGRYVLAQPAGEPLGAFHSEMYVLDAHTGELVAEFAPPREARTYVAVWQAAWEDGDTVLALVQEDDAMKIVRAGVDGSLESASGIFEVTDLNSPLWFADTPRD